ncbi:MAG: integrase family protein [Alphaproteobacteria bacterium]|jgi:integrase|nr:integrase family protein [Alphaproteobacteria bacterium]
MHEQAMAAFNKREPNRRELTDRFIRDLKPPAEKTLYWDTKKSETYSSGLCLIALPTGHKSFKVVYRSAGLLRWYNVGTYGKVYLKEAREVAREINKRVALGEDPHLDKMKSREGITFKHLAEKYQERYAKRVNKSWKQPADLLRWHVYGTLGSRKAKDISRDDVRRLFRQLSDDRPILANQVLAAISAIYGWALGEEEPDIQINPATGIRRNPTRERERVLTDGELRLVWPKFDDFGLVKATALRCVLLTAQRGGEVLHMRGEHIDGQWWTMPGRPEAETGWPGVKNALDHRIWLSTPVMALLHELGLPERGFVFTHERGQPLQDLSAVTREIWSELNIPRFTPHDLRRSTATSMTGMGIDRLTVSRILNHREGGITRVYDRHSYDAQKRNALEAWAGRLEEIVAGKAVPEKVIKMERA